MRILTVFDGELAGVSGDQWALLETLVAANGPEPPEVRVMTLVSRARRLVVVGSPPYPPATIVASSDHSGLVGVSPADSARQRLAHALHYLRELGIRASGDIEAGKVYQAVKREAVAGQYGRILLLLGHRSSWRGRVASRVMAARLRVSANVPVDAPTRADLGRFLRRH